MTCTPEALADLATCFVEVSDGQRDSMLTYLVGQVSFGPQIITDLIYVLSDSDNGQALLFSNTQTQIIVVPPTLTTGFTCTCERLSTGMLHVFPRSGLTVSTVNGFRVDTAGTATLSLSGVTLTVGGNITTDLLEIGGLASGSFTNDAFVTASFTCITGTDPTSIRQNGFLRGVTFRNSSLGSATGFSFRIFRPNGGNFDFVGKCEDFGTANGTNQTSTKRFTMPVPCQATDRIGERPEVSSTVNVKTGGTTQYAAGDIQGTDAFASSIADTLCCQALGVSPLICCTGDSIIAGSNGSPNFNPYLATGPSGTVTAQIINQVGATWGTGAEFQNLALANTTFAWALSTGVPACISAKAAWIWIHCGVNDVATGRTWPQIVADLDAIKALLVNGERLILDEILPWTNSTDLQAATIRTYNANLATWCSLNDATLLVCHNAMGQLRVSTGFLDDLKTAYDFDGVHLTQSGIDAMAAIFVAQMGLT